MRYDFNYIDCILLLRSSNYSQMETKQYYQNILHFYAGYFDIRIFILKCSVNDD